MGPAPAPRCFAGALGALDRATRALAGAGVLAFAAIVVYVALGRYLVGRTPYWSEEAPRTLLVWTVFIGLVSATIRGSHLDAGLLALVTQDDARRARLAAPARIATVIFLAILAWAGALLTLKGADSVTTALQIPDAVAYAALPLGAGLAALAALARLIGGTSR
ncbi:MAG: TRAP transporter small permease subunit [Methylobacteriaceae bacterium]|nr:TRAP transporter small permease subunit [Methylobacteriaceae bacterium]